jgi:hypothetical protein
VPGVRIGQEHGVGQVLSESRWQTLVIRGRTYSREMADAKTDDEAIQIAVDAVHEDRRGR